MADITITISGAQGVGKTALQDVLHEYLEACGLTVEYPDRPHSKIASQLLTHLAPSVRIEEVPNG